MLIKLEGHNLSHNMNSKFIYNDILHNFIIILIFTFIIVIRRI